MENLISLPKTNQKPLAELNDEARKKVQLSSRRGDRVIFSADARRRGMAKSVLAALKRSESVSRFAENRDFGTFYVGDHLFSFRIEYISLDGAATVSPGGGEPFRRIFLIRDADDVQAYRAFEQTYWC